MPSDIFDSSDSVRTARSLKYAQYATFREPLKLELGGRLPEVTVAFETYGQLNARRDNAVLICHALSGDSHVARHDADDDPGWWEVLVGPGKPIDTGPVFCDLSELPRRLPRHDRARQPQPGDRPALCHRLPRHHRRRHCRGAAAARRPPWASSGCGLSSAGRWAAT